MWVLSVPHLQSVRLRVSRVFVSCPSTHFFCFSGAASPITAVPLYCVVFLLVDLPPGVSGSRRVFSLCFRLPYPWDMVIATIVVVSATSDVFSVLDVVLFGVMFRCVTGSTFASIYVFFLDGFVWFHDCHIMGLTVSLCCLFVCVMFPFFVFLGRFPAYAFHPV